jgi:4-hydroxy-tetrahydrodipicolinate synthase
MKEMVRRFRAGDVDGARTIDETLSPLWELDDVAVNPIPIKTALALVGQDVGGFRLPMVPATDDELERVRDCLARAGLSVTAAAA